MISKKFLSKQVGLGDQLSIGPKESVINVVPSQNGDIAVADSWKQFVGSFRTVCWLFAKSLTTAWPFFDGILGTSCSHFGDGMNLPT